MKTARHADHHGRVPLANMFGYSTDLRSRTQGRATYSMHFDRYEQAPQRELRSHRAKAGPQVERGSLSRARWALIQHHHGDKIRIRLKAYDAPPARPEHRRDRRHRQAHGRAAGGPDSAADRINKWTVLRVAARRQEVARAVRDPHPQAAASTSSSRPADARLR
jgi:hypothetical protein